MEIVLHSDDITLLQYWENSLSQSCEVADTIEDLTSYSNSIIIINYSACHEWKSLLETLTLQKNKVLLLHRVPDFATTKQFLAWGVKGYGNALMREHFLVAAVETLQDGMVWLYPEFTTQLIAQMDSGVKEGCEVHLKKLSQREQDVTLLLKEGDIYKVIAEKLGITSRTVKAHAQSIYTKLNVKDRLGLALLLK